MIEGGGGDAVGAEAARCEQVERGGADVVGAVAQRRDDDREHGEAVVEVLAEGGVLDGGGEVAVGGGDDARVGAPGLGRAEAGEGAVLEEAQELDLDRGGELADLVEEQGAAVRGLGVAGLGVDRAGVGALVAAEQLALDEGLGERGGVDLDERAGAARAGVVDRAGQEVLAGAALAEQEDGLVGGGDAAGVGDDAAHRGGLGDDAAEALARVEPAGEGVGPRGDRAALDDVADAHPELVHRERLDEVVGGAELHRLDGVLRGRVRGHQHDVGVGR